MTYLDPTKIESWHAHVYFDATSRDAALVLRHAIDAQFGATVQLGRFHEKPVGPHPAWSYQIAFAPAELPAVVSWLSLNHGALDVFLHPNTDDSLRDHRDCAIWFGRSYQLKLDNFG
ncbi:DOPA 4,5-dioxygenase family protein [Paraburkholderia phosphatilytica]|uniref:DOPA 4,5-dioxygenase family protein n=1 Tax=Paraburkholderia phosphatilytica TaxID=2282883 RepID=UPI000E518D31|nr:DOPA 4,5-dioxygenase family protein [Paraburkholderia phosphatilytica]